MLHMAVERTKIYVHGNHHVKLNVENKNTVGRKEYITENTSNNNNTKDFRTPKTLYTDP